MMEDDLFDVMFSEEVRDAKKTVTNDVYHYTSTEAGILGVLATGKLRLSSFDFTNDLWESRPIYPQIQAHADDADLVGDSLMPLWNDVDRLIRRNAKVACLTQDFCVEGTAFISDALRGWNHLALWAHYGENHRGICLRFDKAALITEFENATPDTASNFHGPVEYRSVSVGLGPHGLDVGQIQEFGLDAVARVHASMHADALFFRKHQDWASEAEYRLVRVDESNLPFYLPISTSLTGVYLGEGFSEKTIPVLREVLSSYPGVDVYKMTFGNRRFECMRLDDLQLPTEPSMAMSYPGKQPTRNGSLTERIALLRDAITAAAAKREQARQLTSHLKDTLVEDFGRLYAAGSFPETKIEMRESITAIPAAVRTRAPGTPGEQVHYETGVLLILSNSTDPQKRLICAGAFQVLDESKIRFHVLVELEPPDIDSSAQFCPWKASIDVPFDECEEVWASQFEALSAASLTQIKDLQATSE